MLKKLIAHLKSRLDVYPTVDSVTTALAHQISALHEIEERQLAELDRQRTAEVELQASMKRNQAELQRTVGIAYRFEQLLGGK